MEDFTLMVPDGWNTSQSIIKVIGVGGGGCNAVTEMYRQGIKDVEFMICNTDMQSLRSSDVPEKLRLGTDLTRGLGAGCDPEKGRRAASESVEDIKKALEGNTEMVFITAGMGGGTGTGAAPVVAQIAKELDLLTVGVVTLPFRDEGKEFVRRAIKGIKELQKHVDSLLIIDNQKLYQVFGELTLSEAFPRADSVLNTAVRSIAELITKPGYINVDFADVKMVMKNSGMAIMGEGEAEGEDRAIEAVRRAFESPLLNDCDLSTAKGVLVNITSSKEDGNLTMAELSQIMEYVNSYTGQADRFKRGVVFDSSMGKKINVTIVATGFNVHNLPQISEDEDDNLVVLGSRYGHDPNINKNAKVISINNNFGPNEAQVSKQKDADLFSQNDNEAQSLEDSEQIEVATPIKKPNTPYSNSTLYKRKEGKPALIIESGDDITVLEAEPAFIRRNKKENPATAKVENPKVENPIVNRMKLEEVEGQQRLSTDNSYLHRTQD